ncbi:MAG: tetratricopeptide repeat protein [Bdellovibrionales bacterium]
MAQLARNFRILFVVLIAVGLSACSSVSTKKSPSEVSSNPYYDGNQAPEAMRPPQDFSTDKVLLDPLYLNTQADYHYTLGESYSLEGSADRAIEEFKLTLVYDPNSAKVRLRLASEYVRKGMISEALEQAKTAVQNEPNYYEARVLYAGILASLKVYDEAEAEYKTTIARFPDKKDAVLHYGALLAEEKKYDESIAQFMSLTKDKNYETPHIPYYYAGRVYSEVKNYSSAEECYVKSLLSKPDFEESVLALGRLFEDTKKRERTLQLFETFQDKQGPSERVAELLARLYLEDEEYEKAYRQYEIIEAADGANLNVKVKMALILIEKKNFDQAIAKLKQVLAQAPDSDKIRFYLAAVHEETKEYDTAIEHFSKIPTSSSFYVESIVHMSYLQKVKGDLPQAIQTVEAALKMNPDAEQLYTIYGSLLHENKQYNQAVAAMLKATEKFPKNDQIWFFLGSLYDKLEKKEETITTMKTVLDLNETHYQAMNYLAYTYADIGQNLPEAESLAKKALALKSDDGYIQDTLGWILFKQGRFDESVRVLELAYQLKSDEAIIAEHLGDAYHRMSLPSKAKKMYQRAIQLETDTQVIHKLNSKISAIDAVMPSRIPASAD